MQNTHIKLMVERDNCISQKISLVHFSSSPKCIQEVNPHSELMTYQILIRPNGPLIKSSAVFLENKPQFRTRSRHKWKAIWVWSHHLSQWVTVALPHTEHFLLPWT